MTRRRGKPIRVPSWTVNGVIENIDIGSFEVGTLESALNAVPLPGRKLATRGGRRLVHILTSDGSALLDNALMVGEYSPTGAYAIGYDEDNSKHYANLAAADFASVSQRVDLTDDANADWDTLGRPWGVELFEKLFICDAIDSFTDRHQFCSVDASGTLTVPTFDFDGGGAEAIKPFAMETFKSVLFIAGGKDEGGAEEVALLRHSLLGTSPDTSTTGFDSDAWNIIGAKGKGIRALRAGRDQMIVAKRSGLWRVAGNPLAIAGFQFAVEGLDGNDQGFGVSNPYALEYYNGWWYGIGDQGPFRTNGFDVVDPIVNLRADSWNAFEGDIDLAWVSAHPERHVIIFGMPGASDAYPQELWIWDTLRERWFGDWDSGQAFRYGAKVVNRSATPGPSGAPSSLVVSNITETAFDISFTAADATASHEVWLEVLDDVGQGVAAAWALQTLLSPGDSTYSFTGLTGYTHYRVRVRGLKQGLYTAYDSTAGTDVYTNLPAPSWYRFEQTLDALVYGVQQKAADTDIEVDRRDVDVGTCANPGSYGNTVTYSSQPLGNMLKNDNSVTFGQAYQARARSVDSAWGGTTTSDYTEHTDNTALQTCATVGDTDL